MLALLSFKRNRPTTKVKFRPVPGGPVSGNDMFSRPACGTGLK